VRVFFGLPPRLRLLARAFRRLRRLPHHRRILAERRTPLVVAHHVVAFHPQPQIGNRQMHPPRGIRRVQAVRPRLQPVVEQAQASLSSSPPGIVHNHVLRHSRPRVVHRLALQIVHARLWRGDFDDQRRTRPLDRHVERAPVLPLRHAGDDHHIRSVRTHIGKIPRDAHIAEDDGDASGFEARAQHRRQVHPVGLVTVAMHDEISRFRVQDVLQRERNLFQVMGVVGGRARHETPAVAERIGVWRRVWRRGTMGGRPGHEPCLLGR
jgi:hypothetical protein